MPCRLFSMAVGLFLAAATLAPADEPPTYQRDVRPLLTRRCTVCHSAKAKGDLNLSGGLALDSLAAIREGTADHKVVEPGQAATSALYRRLVTDNEDERMPLNEDALPETDRELVKRWIDAGMPEGSAPAPAAVAAAPSPRRHGARTLEVAIATEAKVPARYEGLERPGQVGLSLPIGPLPAVTALAFDPEGPRLAVGTVGRVTVWNLAEGRPVLELHDIPGAVHALAVRPEDHLLAVGAGLPSRTGVVRVYSLTDGQLLHDLAGHADAVYGVAIAPDGKRLASASFDQTVRIWDLEKGSQAAVVKGHSDFVLDVAFAADGKSLLSASKDRSIKQSDAATGASMRTFSGHDAEVMTLAVRPDGKGFVSSGEQPLLYWWTFDKDQPARKVGGHNGPVHQVAFSADGKKLISASGDRTVRLWDGTTGNPLRTLNGPTEWQFAAALSPDGRLAAAGGWDGLVRVWEADSGKLLATLIQPPGESEASADWLAVAPSGAWDASPELAAKVAYRVAGADGPADVLSRVLHRPDAVKASLNRQSVTDLFARP